MSFKHNSVRRAIALIAAFVTVLTVNCAGAGTFVSAASSQKGSVTANALNVRKSPGTGNEIINVIHKGDSVEIVKTENGWHRITQGKNKYGWVSAAYISIGNGNGKKNVSETAANEKNTVKNTVKDNGKTNGTVTVTGSYTNLRKGAGTGYGVIKRLTYGTTGDILEKKGSWYRIKLKDAKTGWVYKQYVKVTGNKEQAESASKNDHSKSKKIVVSVSTVNVRTLPSTTGKLITAIRKNEVYPYSEIKDGWYRIVTPSGVSGYVSGKYVEKFKSYAIDGGGKYIWPTQTTSRMTTRFGVRNHKGIDIAAPGGSQIIAVADGTVCTVSYNPKGFGHLIVIKQNDGIKAYYGHMQKETFLKKGDKVKAVDTIGVVGSTGKSTGNHLHLEFRKGDERIDPLTYYPNMK